MRTERHKLQDNRSASRSSGMSAPQGGFEALTDDLFRHSTSEGTAACRFFVRELFGVGIVPFQQCSYYASQDGLNSHSNMHAANRCRKFDVSYAASVTVKMRSVYHLFFFYRFDLNGV